MYVKYTSAVYENYELFLDRSAASSAPYLQF